MKGGTRAVDSEHREQSTAMRQEPGGRGVGGSTGRLQDTVRDMQRAL